MRAVSVCFVAALWCCALPGVQSQNTPQVGLVGHNLTSGGSNSEPNEEIFNWNFYGRNDTNMSTNVQTNDSTNDAANLSPAYISEWRQDPSEDSRTGSAISAVQLPSQPPKETSAECFPEIYSCRGRCGDPPRVACSCHLTCQVYGNCCEDFADYCPLLEDKSSTHSHQEETERIASSASTKVQCVANSWVISSCATDFGEIQLAKLKTEQLKIQQNNQELAWISEFLRSRTAYNIVTKCMNTRLSGKGDNLASTPVTANGTGLHFKNFYCALCNGFLVPNFWVGFSVCHPRLQSERCDEPTTWLPPTGYPNSCFADREVLSYDGVYMQAGESGEETGDTASVDGPQLGGAILQSPHNNETNSIESRGNDSDQRGDDLAERCEHLTSYMTLKSDPDEIYKNAYCFRLIHNYTAENVCEPIIRRLQVLPGAEYRAFWPLIETRSDNEQDSGGEVGGSGHNATEGESSMSTEQKSSLKFEGDTQLHCVEIQERQTQGNSGALNATDELPSQQVNGQTLTDDRIKRYLNFATVGFQKIHIDESAMKLPSSVEIRPCLTDKLRPVSESLNNQFHEYCASYTLRWHVHATMDSVVGNISLEGIITIICCVLSDIGLLVRLILQQVVPFYSSYPAKVQFSLCLTLLLAYTLFLLGGIVDEGSRACRIISTMTHLAFLSALFWMNVTAFEIWRTFRHWRNQVVSRGRTSLILSAVYAVGIPLSIVITALVIEELYPWSEFSPNYGEYFCWLNGSRAVAVFFVTPCSAICGMNTIFVGLTLRGLRRQRTSISKLKKSNTATAVTDTTIVVKIILLVGITWLLGLVAALVNHQVLWIIFTIINASLGFLISAVLVLNKRVFHAIQKKCLCYANESIAVVSTQ
ncbi:G-protein coupled receptor mth2-like, partial [Plakobranchus ocellatus]